MKGWNSHSSHLPEKCNVKNITEQAFSLFLFEAAFHIPVHFWGLPENLCGSSEKKQDQERYPAPNPCLLEGASGVQCAGRFPQQEVLNTAALSLTKKVLKREPALNSLLSSESLCFLTMNK